MTQTLILIRGIPGSGKSTLAKEFKDYVHFEADMWFELTKQKFGPSLLKFAHVWCQREAQWALARGHNVVVSNTFTQHWEMKPYLDMAKDFGVRSIVIVCTGKFKSIHNVPEETLRKMKERWEE